MRVLSIDTFKGFETSAKIVCEHCGHEQRIEAPNVTKTNEAEFKMNVKRLRLCPNCNLNSYGKRC